MKEQGHYWKQPADSKEIMEINFSFDTFIQTLQIVSTYGFKNLKSDLSTRMLNLFNHIYKNMSMNDKFNEIVNSDSSLSNKINFDQIRNKFILAKSQDTPAAISKDGSEIFISSNRSGYSGKKENDK